MNVAPQLGSHPLATISTMKISRGSHEKRGEGGREKEKAKQTKQRELAGKIAEKSKTEGAQPKWNKRQRARQASLRVKYQPTGI